MEFLGQKVILIGQIVTKNFHLFPLNFLYRVKNYLKLRKKSMGENMYFVEVKPYIPRFFLYRFNTLLRNLLLSHLIPYLLNPTLRQGRVLVICRQLEHNGMCNGT